jgi:hypothetical protein
LTREANGGIVVSLENPEQLANAVLVMKENQVITKLYGENGYTYVKQNLDRPMLAREMEAVLQDAVGRR